MDPRELLAALEAIENNAWEIEGIYHSHPHGPEYPSHADLNEHLYPTVKMCILYPIGDPAIPHHWNIRSYQISGERFTVVPVRIKTDEGE